MPYINVDIQVDLAEFSDDDLLEELERRKLTVDSNDNDIDYELAKELIEKIYLKRMFGLDFLKEVDDLIYTVVGRMV
jgi:hypothetical protein